MRAVSQIVACDIHPLNNLVTLNYLKKLGHDQASVDEWYRAWVIAGFEAIELLLQPGPYCFGAAPGMADLCLVPQVFNARRFKVSLDAFPKIAAVEAACAKLAAFDKARPENQPDMPNSNIAPPAAGRRGSRQASPTCKRRTSSASFYG